MVTGTNLDVVQEPRVRVKYAGHESVNVSLSLITYYCISFPCPVYCLVLRNGGQF